MTYKYNLIRISTESPSLEQFDPEHCVKHWLSAKKIRKELWPSDGHNHGQW